MENNELITKAQVKHLILQNSEDIDVDQAWRMLSDIKSVGTYEELEAYRAAEQDGTLLRLPCKPGTRWKNKFGEIYVVHGFNFDSKHGWQVIHYKEENKMVDDYIHSVDFKYWERNMVPAEAALKEQESNNESI